MELIIGGVSQGKLNYAIENLDLQLNENGSDIADGILKNNALIIVNFQNIIRNLMLNGENVKTTIDNFVDLNPNCIIICDEVGCGLVPIEQFERDYRDMVGHVCCDLAKKSTRVHRVLCGIGMVIKYA